MEQFKIAKEEFETRQKAMNDIYAVLAAKKLREDEEAERKAQSKKTARIIACIFVVVVCIILFSNNNNNSSPRNTNVRTPSISTPSITAPSLTTPGDAAPSPPRVTPPRDAAAIPPWITAQWDTTPSVTPEIVFDEPEVDFPPNGYHQILDDEIGVAQFKVITPPRDSFYYYVLLRDASTDKTVVTVYIHPGETVSIDVPLGRYRMYYATGLEWYGTTHLFGPNTQYSKADTILRFYLEGVDGIDGVEKLEDLYDLVSFEDLENIRVVGCTIELISRAGGNMSTSTASADDFIVDELDESGSED